MRMRRQPMSRSILLRTCRTALCVLAALATAIAVSAAPVEKAKAKPADSPTPFLLPIEIKPEHLTVLTVGAPFAPRSGPWCALSNLYAGTYPGVEVWSLRGPLSTKPGRILLGASTLFLNGFGPTAALTELGTLQAGDALECWNLINTDEVRPIPKLLLEDGSIRDRHGFSNGTLELETYAKIIAMAHYTSAKAFAKKARHDITYVHLFNEPEHYRGQVVHISGRLVRLGKFDAHFEALAEGVRVYYEGWIMTDKYGENPVCVVFTDLPPGLEVDSKRKYNIEVGFDGYFYKRYRYTAFDTKKANEFRDAPLLIGHTLTGKFGSNGPAEEEETPDNWGHNIIWFFLSVVGGAVVFVIAVTCWFRYHDRRVRQRILATRHAGFVPPPPDELFREGGQVGERLSTESERGPRWGDFPQAPN